MAVGIEALKNASFLCLTPFYYTDPLHRRLDAPRSVFNVDHLSGKEGDFLGWFAGASASVLLLFVIALGLFVLLVIFVIANVDDAGDRETVKNHCPTGCFGVELEGVILGSHEGEEITFLILAIGDPHFAAAFAGSDDAGTEDDLLFLDLLDLPGEFGEGVRVVGSSLFLAGFGRGGERDHCGKDQQCDGFH